MTFRPMSFVMLAVATFAHPAPAQKPDAAKPFTHESAGFTVAFPGKPVVNEVKPPAGKAGRPVVEVTDLLPYRMYRVVSAELPPLPKGGDRKRLITAVQKGLIDDEKAKQTDSKDTTVGEAKHPARDFQATTPDGKQLRALVVVTDKRYYAVVALWMPNTVPQAQVDDFFKSFDIPAKK